MLMYGKEARDRKQEIDRQHHTIPNQRTKDQKTSIVEKSKSLDFSTMLTTTKSPLSFISFYKFLNFH